MRKLRLQSTVVVLAANKVHHGQWLVEQLGRILVHDRDDEHNDRQSKRQTKQTTPASRRSCFPHGTVADATWTMRPQFSYVDARASHAAVPPDTATQASEQLPARCGGKTRKIRRSKWTVSIDEESSGELPLPGELPEPLTLSTPSTLPLPPPPSPPASAKTTAVSESAVQHVSDRVHGFRCGALPQSARLRCAHSHALVHRTQLMPFFSEHVLGKCSQIRTHALGSLLTRIGRPTRFLQMLGELKWNELSRFSHRPVQVQLELRPRQQWPNRPWKWWCTALGD